MVLYYLLYTIALFLMLPGELKKREPKIRKRWLSERTGNYNKSEGADLKSKVGCGSTIWVHAVSVGEVKAAIPLIEKIVTDIQCAVVVSTVTDTGQEVASKYLPPEVKVIYIPFEIPLFLKRALDYIKPHIFIILETELWPGIISHVSGRGIPVLLLNGRISSQSYKGYKKIKFLLGPILKKISLIGVQNELYRQRIVDLGAPAGGVKITGNIKYDVNRELKIPEWAMAIRKPVIVAGSTHDNEEEHLLQVYSELKKEFKTISLILAPRHPERCESVEALIQKYGFEYIKRSAIILDNVSFKKEPPGLVLVDEVGELSSIYGAADICIVGGSFIPRGGQNLLEPAYWGKPVVCGPYMDNFPMTEDFVRRKAVFSIPVEEIYEKTRELLINGNKAVKMGEEALRIYKENRGAVEKCINEIKIVLNQ